MQPLEDLKKGLEILVPFLNEYGFKFDSYENFDGSEGQFTEAIFKNASKKFIVSYSFSIGQVIYQYNHSRITHYFYLDKLGYKYEKNFPDFQFDDKLLSFKNILLDFQYLVDDFFNGYCSQLTEFAKLRDELIKAQEEYEYKIDILKIEQARTKFRMKEYKNSLEIFLAIDHKTLLNDLDKKIIDFCNRQVKDKNGANFIFS